MKTNRLLALVASVMLLSVSVQAQTADEIIDKYLAQTGGKDKWKALKSTRMTGKVKAQGMEIPVTILGELPNKQKIGFSFQGMNLTQLAFDGTTAWNTNQMTMKPEKMEAEESENMKQELFEDSFIDYKTKGYQVALDGKETIDGTECFKLKLTKKPIKVEGKEEENSSFYFIDTQNFVPIMTRSVGKKGQAKGMIQETLLSDYQEVNGLFFPFSITQKFNGNVAAAIAIEKIETNVEIDDKEFAFPESK